MTRVLRIAQVAAELNVSVPTVYRRIAKDPTFPKPFSLGGQAVGIREDELQKWIDTKSRGTTPAPAA